MNRTVIVHLMPEILAAQAPSEAQDHAWVGLLLWLTLFAAAAVRMYLYETRFLRLYRQLRDQDFLMPHEKFPHLGRPDRVFGYGFSFVGQAWGRLQERQSEPNLEQARQQAVRSIRLMMAVAILGSFLPFAFSFL